MYVFGLTNELRLFKHHTIKRTKHVYVVKSEVIVLSIINIISQHLFIHVINEHCYVIQIIEHHFGFWFFTK